MLLYGLRLYPGDRLCHHDSPLTTPQEFLIIVLLIIAHC